MVYVLVHVVIFSASILSRLPSYSLLSIRLPLCLLPLCLCLPHPSCVSVMSLSPIFSSCLHFVSLVSQFFHGWFSAAIIFCLCLVMSMSPLQFPFFSVCIYSARVPCHFVMLSPLVSVCHVFHVCVFHVVKVVLSCLSPIMFLLYFEEFGVSMFSVFGFASPVVPDSFKSAVFPLPFCVLKSFVSLCSVSVCLSILLHVISCLTILSNYCSGTASCFDYLTLKFCIYLFTFMFSFLVPVFMFSLAVPSLV